MERAAAGRSISKAHDAALTVLLNCGAVVADQLGRSSKIAKAKNPPVKPPPDPVDEAAVAAESVDLSDLGALADEFGAALEEAAVDAAVYLLGEVGLAEDEQIVNIVSDRAVAAAREQAAELVSNVTDSTRNMIRDVIANGLEDNIGLMEIADNIAASAAFSDERALLIARTEVRNANERGVLEGLKGARSAGVNAKKEWLLGPDPCEICQENADAGPIDLDDTFPSGDTEPTAHPNAVIAGYSFGSYGPLKQLLRARYNGPVVTLKLQLVQDLSNLSFGNFELLPNASERDILFKQCLDRGAMFGRKAEPFGLNIEFTIGPNHPMLTRRGFVPAKLLKEGDQLLYDLRGVSSMSSVLGKTNLNEVPLIEDVFESLGDLFGFTASPPVGFHGDEVSIDGKVEVVRPTRDLLFEFDTCGLEQFSECQLSGAYTEAAHVSGCSACQLLFERMFAAACCSIGGGSPLFSFNEGACGSPSSHSDAISGALPGFGSGVHTGPPPFCSFTVCAVHFNTYSGLAFDASTASAVYRIGGFVVKNCRCAITGVVEEGYEYEGENPPSEGYQGLAKAGERRNRSMMVTQYEANYLDQSPRDDECCGGCTMFRPDAGGKLLGSCSLVQGTISPRGWCKYWEWSDE